MTPGQGLRSLFDPASVAVVGASADPAKWGYWLASGALTGRERRRVHLVNQRGGALHGVPFHPSLDSLPDAPEHVVVATPPGAVRAVVADGLALGARCFTVITSAVEDERELAALVRAHGARLLGPNCMGVVDTGSELRLSWGDFPRGQVGLVSQSGNLALEIGRLLHRSGQGFSRFVSLGNQRDIDAADAMDALVDHEPTQLIAAYVEDFRDGRRFARVLARARQAGKPVLLLTVGRSEASGRAAASHTGALVSALSTVDAVCRDAGALRLDSAGELVDTALVLLAPQRPAGRRVRVAGDSGGQGALAADTLSAHGLELPALPLDLAGAGEADLHSYARIADAMLSAADTDLALLTGYFGDYATGNPAQADQECAVAHELADAAADSGRTLLVHTMARDTPALAVLRERGVPVFERVEQAAAAAAHAAHWAEAVPRDPLPLPAPRPAPADGGYEAVRAVLQDAGIAFPEARFVTTADEAVQAAGALGGPVALKAMGLAHKTEAGGVVLNLRQPADVRAQFRAMRARTGADRYAVEAMAGQRGVELILGVRRDPAFGPVAMVGIGGTAAELLADTAVALAPVSPEQARALVLSLRHAPLLTGWRGAPGLAVDAAAEALSRLSHLAAACPELTDIEVNPLLVHEQGAVALDAAAVVVAEG